MSARSSSPSSATLLFATAGGFLLGYFYHRLKSTQRGYQDEIFDLSHGGGQTQAAGQNHSESTQTTEAVIEELNSRFSELEKKHMIEYGRLESRALAALEDSHSEATKREEELEKQLNETRDALRAAQDEIYSLRSIQ